MFRGGTSVVITPVGIDGTSHSRFIGPFPVGSHLESIWLYYNGTNGRFRYNFGVAGNFFFDGVGADLLSPGFVSQIQIPVEHWFVAGASDNRVELVFVENGLLNPAVDFTIAVAAQVHPVYPRGISSGGSDVPTGEAGGRRGGSRGQSRLALDGRAVDPLGARPGGV